MTLHLDILFGSSVDFNLLLIPGSITTKYRQVKNRVLPGGVIHIVTDVGTAKYFHSYNL